MKIKTKKLILVVSPPACGKTYVSQKVAENVKHIVYLDKDTLIPMSKVIFQVGNEPVNRSSAFFQKYIRDVEYETILDIAFEALQYANRVLVNAPFTREIHDRDYLVHLRNRLEQERNAALVVIWVSTDPELCHQRMIARNSDRDTWKLEHWDEYIKTVDFTIPAPLLDPQCVDEFYRFNNGSTEEFNASMKFLVPQLERHALNRLQDDDD